MKVKFTPEQRRRVSEIVERRLIADRRRRARGLQAMIVERDALAVEVAALRAELKQRKRSSAHEI